jgi:S1-C subfamily serine protease
MPRSLPLCLFALALLATPALAAEVPASQQQMQLTFAPLVKSTAPAVVNVYVTTRVKEFVSPFGNDPFFREFFGDGVGVPRERMENSLGSGVIVSEDGLIVTNNHVVKGGGDAEIRVALADKREFDARIILRDEKLDLAVLRLQTSDRRFPTRSKSVTWCWRSAIPSASARP